MTLFKKNTVLIVGAGNGGCAFAADLTQRKISVNLYAHPDFDKNIKAIHQQGYLTAKGLLQGNYKIDLATTNIEQALQGVQYIFIVLPAFAQENIFKLM